MRRSNSTSSALRNFIREVLTPQFSISRRNVDPYNVTRQAVPIRTQFWSLGAPVGAKPLQHAACSVIMNPNGKFLGVSRKNNPTDFGFPGGHVDPGESPEEAAIRELEEETGLKCTSSKKLVTLKDRNVKVHVFVCSAEGDVNTDEHGVVDWVSAQQLLSGSFGKQNQVILRMLGVNT